MGTNSSNERIASFTDIEVKQGTAVETSFLVNNSQDQRFILDNSQIDTSTIVVKVKGPNETGEGREYRKIDNILNLNKNSEIFLIQEVQDEKVEILFGDGFFGKKLEDNSQILIRYIITDGAEGNGAGGRAGSTGVFD